MKTLVPYINHFALGYFKMELQGKEREREREKGDRYIY